MKAIWDHEHASHWKRIWWHAETMIKRTYTVKFNKKNPVNLIQNIKAQIDNFLHLTPAVIENSNWVQTGTKGVCGWLVVICQQNLTPFYAYIWNMWPYKHLFQQTALDRLYLHHQPGQLGFQHTKHPPSVPATWCLAHHSVPTSFLWAEPEWTIWATCHQVLAFLCLTSAGSLLS